MAKEKKVKDESPSPSFPQNGATDGEEHGKSTLLFSKCLTYIPAIVVDEPSISDTLLAQIESKIASGALKLPAKDWVRSLEYRKPDKGKPHELKGSNMTRAAWGQATGVEVPKVSWCRTCASDNGPFTSCVIADDGKKLLGQGACMSCAYYGHPEKCSFGT
jgi:hypothetical protein